MAKEKKKTWYLHFDYLDNWGIQHSMKYKMPKDFQQNVAVILDKQDEGHKVYFTYD